MCGGSTVEQVTVTHIIFMDLVSYVLIAFKYITDWLNKN